MQSYTIIQTPKAGRLLLTVPHEFEGKRLTITIAEAEQNPTTLHHNAELLELLLTAPTLSEEELQGFTDARVHLNEWSQA
jgi:hypothetical protein